jgi:hypothetical protein
MSIVVKTPAFHHLPARWDSTNPTERPFQRVGIVPRPRRQANRVR